MDLPASFALGAKSRVCGVINEAVRYWGLAGVIDQDETTVTSLAVVG